MKEVAFCSFEVLCMYLFGRTDENRSRLEPLSAKFGSEAVRCSFVSSNNDLHSYNRIGINGTCLWSYAVPFTGTN